MPVILATREAEIRRFTVQANSLEKKNHKKRLVEWFKQ
jgi:hypothetical protein